MTNQKYKPLYGLQRSSSQLVQRYEKSSVFSLSLFFAGPEKKDFAVAKYGKHNEHTYRSAGKARRCVYNTKLIRELLTQR